MKSRLVFSLHASCLFSLVASALASGVIKNANPRFFAEIFFPGFIALSSMTLVSWKMFGGCPLTKLEKHFRRQENKAPYEGSCMVHYLQQWTGRKANSTVIHVALVGVMAVPVIVRYF